MGNKQQKLWQGQVYGSGSASMDWKTGGTTGSYGSKSGGFHQGGCGHQGKLKFWQFDGRALYPAGSNIQLDQTVQAVIDLSGNAEGQMRKFSIVGDAQAFVSSRTDEHFRKTLLGALEAHAQDKPLYIRLDWPDMGVPKGNLGVTFWRTLWHLLPRATNEQPAKITVNCMGGHGRTGTALAAFLIAVGDFKWTDAVNFVRLHHCTNAIETSVQIDYLKQLSAEAGTISKPTDQKLANELDQLVGALPKEDVQPGPGQPGPGQTAQPDEAALPTGPDVASVALVNEAAPVPETPAEAPVSPVAPVVTTYKAMTLAELPNAKEVLVLQNNRPVWMGIEAVRTALGPTTLVYGARF